jgi:hypothetical protein
MTTLEKSLKKGYWQAFYSKRDKKESYLESRKNNKEIHPQPGLT